MKKYPRYAECVRRYSRNLIYGDKTTTGYGYYDNESACFGMFLGGYADNYAVRFDQFGWSYSGRAKLFGEEYGWQVPNSLAWLTCPEAVAGMSISEHLMMSGATVIDGPEISTLLVMRYGRLTPSGKNVVTDVMRKVIDGMIRIPTRDEVRSRVRAAYICNSTSNVEDNLYSGLYGMDGNKRENRTWLKRTGRYLTIPTFASVPEYDGFDVIVTQSGGDSYASRWATDDEKVAELNSLYPEEYSGTMYVGRYLNRLLAYNPNLNENVDTHADIPLKYNTCNALSLDFTPHTFAVVTERTTGLDIYLNNYRTDKDSLWDVYPSVSEDDGLERMQYHEAIDYVANELTDNPTDKELRRSVVTVKGCTSKPYYTWTDRGSHPETTVAESYSGGTLTLTIMHNGPLDLAITCGGSNTDRAAEPEFAPVADIPAPDMQAVAECPFLYYDFEDMAEGEIISAATQPSIAAEGAGAAMITEYGGSMTLNPTAIGSGDNRIGVADLTLFGAERDYSVTWKEYVDEVSKGGVLMRGVPSGTAGNPGLCGGYYFQVNTDIARGTTQVAIRKVINMDDGTTRFDNGPQGEVAIPAPHAGSPRWYRATCKNNLLTLEYSDDGQTFTRIAARTDCRYYEAGNTQLLWGVGVPQVTSTYYDDISLTYLSSTVTVPDEMPAETVSTRYDTDRQDVSTPVDAVSSGDASVSGGDGTWYTLQGVRVERPAARGIYIRNGRKYVVK